MRCYRCVGCGEGLETNAAPGEREKCPACGESNLVPDSRLRRLWRSLRRVTQRRKERRERGGGSEPTVLVPVRMGAAPESKARPGAGLGAAVRAAGRAVVSGWNRFGVLAWRVSILGALVALVWQMILFRSDLNSIQSDVGSMQTDVDTIQSDVESIESHVGSIKRLLRSR